MKKIVLILGTLWVSLWAERCDYIPYNENYTREMAVNNTLYVMENDEFGCKLEMNEKFKTIGY